MTTAKIADNSISHAKLQADIIDGDNIADDVINSEHYVAASIDTEHIADAQVTAAKIATDTITATQIAANAITASELANDAVDTSAIVNDAVTGAKLADDSVNSEHYVDGSIDTAHIADNQVTHVKLAADAVDGDNIADNSINSEHYVDGSIDTEHIADSQVTAAKLASNSVTTVKIADDAVTAAKLAVDAVVSSNIVNANITTAKIAADAIDATKIADDAVTTDHIADAELTTLAGMQSGTASILAAGTTLTATLAEINTVVDGKSVETTISDTDAAYPTSGAVVDYVAAQIAPVGGLEVIATDAAFPNAQPGSGVVVSIADAGGLVVNGSGVSTTGRTVGGSTVTINNINSQFNSTTIDAGVAMMVSSTGSSHTYNYHKATLKEADLLNLSGDINDFAERYRVSADPDNLSNKDEGDLVYDTNANKMKVYDNSTSAWKEVTSTGDFKFLVPVDAGTTTAATWDGSDTSFDLKEATNSGNAASITSVNQLIVSLNGVIQKPNAGSWSGSGEGFYLTDADTIRFATAPPSGSSCFIIQCGSAVTIPTPGDNTVSTAKVQNLAVTTAKIAADAIDGTKLADNAVNSEHYTDGSIDLAHMSSESVDEDNLYISNAGSNGQFLQKQSGNNGGLTWATVDLTTFTADVTFDNQSNAGRDIVWDESDDALEFADDTKAVFGAGNDLSIYHNGTDSFLDSITGSLKIRSNNGNMAVFTPDGAVELYHNEVKKLWTESWGINIDGNLALGDSEELIFGGSDDFKIYHDGTYNWIDAVNNHGTVLRAGTGILYLQGSEIHIGDEGGNEVHIKTIDNGAVELYHDNVKKLTSYSAGIEIHGSEGGNCEVYLYADEGDDDADNWKLTTLAASSTFQVKNRASGSWETNIECNGDGNVELYYDGAKKLETVTGGATITGTCTATAFAGDGSALTGIVSFVTGMIIIWSGAANAIPSGWVICDGNNSTPDLRNRFIVGAGDSYNVNATGGATTDTVTISDSDTVNISISGSGTTGGENLSMGNRVSSGNLNKNHTHDFSFSGSGSDTVNISGSDTVNTVPPYYALCYIMKS